MFCCAAVVASFSLYTETNPAVLFFNWSSAAPSVATTSANDDVATASATTGSCQHLLQPQVLGPSSSPTPPTAGLSLLVCFWPRRSNADHTYRPTQRDVWSPFSLLTA
ncbi:unnamed protein product [Camellia sinensis]